MTPLHLTQELAQHKMFLLTLLILLKEELLLRRKLLRSHRLLLRNYHRRRSISSSTATNHSPTITTSTPIHIHGSATATHHSCRVGIDSRRRKSIMRRDLLVVDISFSKQI